MFDIKSVIRNVHTNCKKLTRNKKLVGEIADIFDSVITDELISQSKQLNGLIRYVNVSDVGADVCIRIYLDEDQLTPSIIKALDTRNKKVVKQFITLAKSVNKEFTFEPNLQHTAVYLDDIPVAGFGISYVKKSAGDRPLWNEDEANGVKNRQYPMIRVDFDLYELPKMQPKVDGDKVIKKIVQICRNPQLLRDAENLPKVVLKLQSQGVSEDTIEEVIEERSVDINKQIAKLFALGKSIKDSTLKNLVLTALEDIFHTEAWDVDNAIQNSLKYTGYKYPINLEEVGDYFEAYLQTHDMSVFDA